METTLATLVITIIASRRMKLAKLNRPIEGENDRIRRTMAAKDMGFQDRLRAGYFYTTETAREGTCRQPHGSAGAGLPVPLSSGGGRTLPVSGSIRGDAGLLDDLRQQRNIRLDRAPGPARPRRCSVTPLPRPAQRFLPASSLQPRRSPRSRGRSMPWATGFRRETPRRARRRSAPASKPVGRCGPSRGSGSAGIDHEGERGREDRERKQGHRRAGGRRQRPWPVHHEADRDQDRSATQQRTRRGRHRIEAFEPTAEDGAAGGTNRAQHVRQLRGKLLAQSMKRLHADDQAYPGHPDDNAEQFSQRRRLLARDGGGQEERENRRGGIENGCKAGVERALAPGNQGPGDHAVEAGLKQEAPPGRGIPRQPQAPCPHHEQQQNSGYRGARRNQRHRRNGRHAELDKGVRPAPQRREQHQQRELARHIAVLLVVHVRGSDPRIFETEHDMAGRDGSSLWVEVCLLIAPTSNTSPP